MPDNLNIFGIQYPGVKGFKLKDTNGNTQTYIKPEGTLNVTSNGITDVTNYASVNVNLPSSVSLDTLNVSHNGTYTPETGHAYSPVNVNILGADVDEDADVVFMDYDGTPLYSYSATEFANLTALPPNPSHTGLTAQGWNWTLADAKTYVQTNGFLDIGQNYITDDGSTRIYIRIDGCDIHPDFGIKFYNSTGVTTVIDWGDGTTTNSTETSLTNYSHTYAQDGNYVVKLTSTTGTIKFPNSSSVTISYPDYAWQKFRFRKIEFGSNISTFNQFNFYGFGQLKSITIPNISGLGFGAESFEYCRSLTGVVFPPDCSNNIGNYAFRYSHSLKRISFSKAQSGSLGNSTFAESIIKRASISNDCTVTSMFYTCRNLEKVVFPTGQGTIGEFVRGCPLLKNILIPNVTSIGANAFYGCNSLESLVLNSNITSITSSAFRSCNNLYSITIPSKVTSIAANAFDSDTGLTELTIPAAVTSIAAQAFNGCKNILEYHFLSETPPTLANTNAFTGIDANCIIYVPRTENPSSEEPTILEKYQTATNWSTYASYMREEPES